MSLTQPKAKLVTVLGGCGFIGSCLCHSLLSAGYRVRVFKREGTSVKRIGGILDQIEMFTGDHSSSDDVISAIQDAQTVVHLIHTTVPGTSMRDPAFDLQSNVVSTASWLARLPETAVANVIYVSSGGTVYGAPRSLPISEDHPLNPMSTYGITKLACEKFVAMYSELAGIEYRILRPANAYGGGQRDDRGQGVLGVLTARIALGKPLEVWGSGKGLRDYIHIDDIVRAIIASMEYSGSSHIFNVSTGNGRSVLGLIEALGSRFVHLPDVHYLPDRGFDVPDNVLDNSLLRKETGWEPRISLEEGIDQMLTWNRESADNMNRGFETCVPLTVK